MESSEQQPTVHRGHWNDVAPAIAYGVARLRYAVYTMEQGITEEEDLDGRELEPGTLIYWIEQDGLPVATLRVLCEEDGSRAVGRVATARPHRGKGLAGRLLDAALQDHRDFTLELHAQAHLEEWYGRFGFVTAGEVYEEAGIPHIPMVRPGATATS
ncbi:GNAT family N-acetyltransferase [Rothia halotolerans]|uniref:GNAT family N-acetyltransferase n=1 Tax=Rothia halotolerans TaxID=405770 RepID=UPI00101D3E8E|nr:GNAT family N-acetyltransferase [Rothia halotolerans]